MQNLGLFARYFATKYIFFWKIIGKDDDVLSTIGPLKSEENIDKK